MKIDEIKAAITKNDLDESQANDTLSVVAKTLGSDLRHKHYKRTVDYAELCLQLITGKDHDKLLHQYVKREDAEAFKQRCEITQTITPAICRKAQSPFNIMGRVNNITEVIDVDPKVEKVESLSKLSVAVDNFHGKKSLKKWMNSIFTRLSWSDPNAFQLTSFFAPKKDGGQDVRPHPVIYFSKDVLNLYYVNGVLQWLFVYDKKTNTHILYIDTLAITFTKTKIEFTAPIPENTYFDYNDTAHLKTGADTFYSLDVLDMKSGTIPVKCIGYIPDETTEYETYISPLDPAINILLKTVKVVSELDFSMANLAHPQVIQQLGPCVADGCNKGRLPEGSLCGACHGSGVKQTPTGANDAIVISLPRNPEDAYNLDNLFKYVHFPVDVVKFDKEYINELASEAIEAIYNSSIFVKNTVVATATEKKIEADSVNNTLTPFASQYSDMMAHNMAIIANYLDIKGFIYKHSFPNDLVYRTRDELIEQHQKLSNSQAPAYVKRGVSRQIADAIFVDNPEELKRIKVKEFFYPFGDKSEVEIMDILASSNTTRYNKVLHTNYDFIFDELELDQPSDRYLYDLPMKEIKSLIDQKVIALIAAIDSEKEPDVPPLDTGLEDDPQDIN